LCSLFLTIRIATLKFPYINLEYISEKIKPIKLTINYPSFNIAYRIDEDHHLCIIESIVTQCYLLKQHNTTQHSYKNAISH